VALNSKLKRILLVLLGWGFILLGIAGLFLPILQGVLFLVIGLIILSTEYVWAHRLLHKLRTRFPTVAKHADAAHLRAAEYMHRWFGGEKTEAGKD